ncbi:MAG: hypothetical protein CVU57_03645 [Deltaproteobacteria bacterium HGW-Deltaproteobacteria-15]|jgi:general secretion pathway protein A|nr:MAG: hypothetical protein CVU57_03645 [Deltaproteobacteria bacterium HGW-Deltaproteobacteria-15]
MYTEYFKLKEKPFNLTPSPRFLYLSESHREALALLTYGVMERKGFVLLTGEVGTGKTTILHTLLSTLDKRVQCVHLSNPLLSPAEFVDYLSHAVFKTPTGKRSKTEFLLQFEEYLRKSAQQQSNFVLVIDEAQKLSFDLLEEIRLLSNMETADEKLINIFLVGQPELNQKLSETRCRPLLQRISVRHHISPLDLKETGEYVATRLKVAGAKDPDAIFPAGTIRALHHHSKGYPRMINILADNALLSAYSKGTKRVTTRMIEQSSEDLHLGAPAVVDTPSSPAWSGSETEKKKRTASRPFWKWGASVAVMVAAGGLFFMPERNIAPNSIPKSAVSSESKPVMPPNPVVMQPVPSPSELAPDVANIVRIDAEPARIVEEMKAETPPTAEKERIMVESARPPVEEKVLQSGPPEAKKAEKVKEPLMAEVLPAGPVEETKAGSSIAQAKSEIFPEKANPEVKAEPPTPEISNADPAAAAKQQTASAETWLVAKKGDTLSKLSVDVYGRVDERILFTLKKKNPSISNIHLIAIGQEIYFPPVRTLEEDSK